MKILLINPKTAKPIQSKYNGPYRVKRKQTSIVKTVFYSGRIDDFCRGAKYTEHIIDNGRVYSVVRIDEDNFDGHGVTKYRVNLVGKKYDSYLYPKPCVVVA